MFHASLAKRTQCAYLLTGVRDKQNNRLTKR